MNTTHNHCFGHTFLEIMQLIFQQLFLLFFLGSIPSAAQSIHTEKCVSFRLELVKKSNTLPAAAAEHKPWKQPWVEKIVQLGKSVRESDFVASKQCTTFTSLFYDDLTQKGSINLFNSLLRQSTTNISTTYAIKSVSLLANYLSSF